MTKRHHSSRSAAKLAIIDALWMVRSRLKLNLYHAMHLIAKNSFSFHVPKIYKKVYRVSMDFLFAWTVSLLFLYFSLSQVKVVSKIKFVSIKSIEMTNNSKHINILMPYSKNTELITLLVVWSIYSLTSTLHQIKFFKAIIIVWSSLILSCFFRASCACFSF